MRAAPSAPSRRSHIGSPAHWFVGSPVRRLSGAPVWRFKPLAGSQLPRLAGSPPAAGLWPPVRTSGSSLALAESGRARRFEPEFAGSATDSPVRLTMLSPKTNIIYLWRPQDTTNDARKIVIHVQKQYGKY